MRDLAKQVREWLANRQKVALAFVVRTWGASPRGIGSVMAISEDGHMAGSVSGGCLEGQVALEAYESLQDGLTRLLTFGTHDEKPWEVGAPCGGDIDVLVIPFDDEVHGALLDCIERGVPFTFAADLEDKTPAGELRQLVYADDIHAAAWSDELFEDEVASALVSMAKKPQTQSSFGGITSIFKKDVFVCHYSPRPKIVCVGAVHIAACLASLAHIACYETIVVDPRKAFLDKERFKDADFLIQGWPQEVFPTLHIDNQTAVCALTHDPKIDVPALAEALKTDAFYIGCLGHAETLFDRRCALESQGFDARDMSRIYGPIGLFIGGREPAQIALSALAQIQAARFGRIGEAEAMPGHTMDFYTPQTLEDIAAWREHNKKGATVHKLEFTQSREAHESPWKVAL